MNDQAATFSLHALQCCHLERTLPVVAQALRKDSF